MTPTATDAEPAVWKSRIVGHDDVDPGTLVANPLNFRTHPAFQRDAIRGALEQVGFIQSVIVNRRSGLILDGHARVALAIEHRQTSVPVVYVELSENEERLMLAALDRITGLAGTDPFRLKELLDQTATDNASLMQLLDRLATENRVVPPPVDFPKLDETLPTEHRCPQCGYEWSGKK